MYFMKNYIFIQVLNLGECKGIHRKTYSGFTTEVIGFFPGSSCNDAGCTRPPSGCTYGNRVYKAGEGRQSCQKCTCEVDILWTCRYFSFFSFFLNIKLTS